MPQKQRLRVWNGDLKKTSGGLTKAMLFRNKRGKIVSRKKSGQASGANNLGKWLRKSGDAFGDRPKGAPDPKPKEKSPSVAAAKPVKAAKAKPKPSPPKPKPAPPKPRKRAEPMKPGEKKELSKVSVGNIVVQKEEKKAEWESWPFLVQTMIRRNNKSKAMVKEIKELREEGYSWKDVREYFKGGSLGPTGLRKKVKKRLKASRRGGKRRTKKTLLQDVLD